MKKKVITFSIIFTAGLVLVLVIAYKAVAHTCFRKQESACRKAKIIKKRRLLKDTYHGQPVEFKSTDGIRLTGLLFIRSHAQKVILMCHGYRSCKEYMKQFVKLFPDDNIFLFDFRSHGESEGTIISIGHFEQKDVHAALSFLKTHQATKDKPIIGVGHSMGAATLMNVEAEKPNFDALILDSPFARLEDQIIYSFSQRTGLPRVPFMTVARKIFEFTAKYTISEVNPSESAKKITCPVFLIHSENDHLVPVSNCYEINKNLSCKKEVWVVRGSCHSRIAKDFSKEYQERVAMFLNNYAQ